MSTPPVIGWSGARVEPVTCGQLLGQASARLAWALTVLHTDPVADANARQAVQASHQVAAATAHLLRTVVPPTGTPAVVPARETAAALALALDELTVSQPRERPPSPAAGSIASAVHEAAIRVGAAADLLATHHDRTGRARSPDADLMRDPGAVDELLHQVGRLTEDQVRVMRAALTRSTGVADVDGEDLAAVDRLARDLQSAAPSAATRAGLINLTVAHPAIRHGDPVVELADRVARLRQAAWDLAGTPRTAGVATLTDFAAVGLLVHAHTAVGALDPDSPSDPPAVQRLLGGVDAWRQLRHQLLPLRSASPALVGVRADLLAVRHWLQTVAPIPPSAGEPRPPVDADTVATLRACAGVLPDIARWNAATFANLVQYDHVMVKAARLPGELLHDDPDRIRAALTGGYLPAPPPALQTVSEAYQRLTIEQSLQNAAPRWMAQVRPARLRDL
jgi:hypothetical protein